MISKTVIRKELIEKRSLLSKDKVQSDSKKILQQIKTLHFSNKIIHLFLPIQDSNEIDTWSIFEHLLLHNNKIATSITLFKPKRLKHTFITQDTTYNRDKYGIPVPKELDTLAEKQIDIVLVPLLACDTQGNRIGYGAGFYDSFLAKCKPTCIKIGLSLFEPLKERIKADVWDIRLDQLITPNTVITF